ncbi:hypothetical protein VNO78_23772 [Psophocarpus tetragonolobus]|uniref:Uncharacterized protein n=1 Tax=Psophocarpus tetragonolobus TaxID=3891 RepID=A0AAN9S488_PSOTE
MATISTLSLTVAVPTTINTITTTDNDNDARPLPHLDRESKLLRLSSKVMGEDNCVVEWQQQRRTNLSRNRTRQVVPAQRQLLEAFELDYLNRNFTFFPFHAQETTVFHSPQLLLYDLLDACTTSFAPSIESTICGSSTTSIVPRHVSSHLEDKVGPDGGSSGATPTTTFTSNVDSDNPDYGCADYGGDEMK